MTIHVNIAEAKSRFSEICAAALRGEEVIVQNAGVPKLRLVALPEAAAEERAARRARIDILLEKMHAIPDREDAFDPMEWDENGLPI
jgi:antitoxin (DNA-binding transcriptional repressor) of toxin-antitoxin stability system